MGTSTNAAPRRRNGSPPLIGRTDELDQLVTAAARPRSVVFLEGEAGLGKTRLLAEALDRPELTGRTVLTGHCRPLCPPLAPVLHALRAAGAAAIAHRTLSPRTGALRPHLPELTPALPAVGDAGLDRHSLVRAVADLLRALGPALLVLEDLHAADESSRHLLNLLLSEPAGDLALLVTYRPREVADGLLVGPSYRPLPGVASKKVALRPLGVAEVGSLVESMVADGPVSDAFAALLHERTGGNPLLVEETVRALHERGSRQRPVPVRVDEATAREMLREVDAPTLIGRGTTEMLSSLPPSARRPVHALAVLGAPSSVDTIARIAELPVERVAATLPVSVEANVLLETDDGCYDFRHALARAAVYRTLPGQERQRLHLRALQVLRRRHETSLVQLADHSRKAGALAEWLRYAEAAADQFAMSGNVSAASELLMALLGEPTLATSDVDRLALKLCSLAIKCRRQREVIAVLERLLDEHALSPSIRGEVRLTLGTTLMSHVGGPEAARCELNQALRDLDDVSKLRAKAMSMLAQPFFGVTPLAEHERWLRQVDGSIDDADDPAFVLSLLADCVSSWVSIGDPRAWDMLARLPAQATTPEGRYQLTRVYTNVADACTWVGYHGRARDFLRRARRLVVDHGGSFACVATRTIQSHLDWLVGEWDGLDERAALLYHENPELHGISAENSLVLGCLAEVRGEWARAGEHFTRIDLAHPENAGFPIVISAWAAVVRIKLARDEQRAARTHAEHGLDLLRRKNHWVWGGELVHAAVDLYCRLGRTVEAHALIREFTEAIGDRHAPIARALATSSRGLLAARCDDLTRAARLFEDAAAQYEQLPAPYFAAQSTERLLHCRIRSGQTGVASQLIALTERFEELGATRDAARCQRLLRDTGSSMPSRHGRRGYGLALSPREQSVARLISHGYANSQIAEVLQISPRTVEKHVAKILRKMNVRSRHDLPSSG
ncbi:ATP-binding protein [Saccharopolyspora taberi]